MKKLKYLLLIILLSITSGCFNSNSMENIDIETTAYPIRYVTERLYGSHSKIDSVYPNGTVLGEVVNDKLLKDYSKSDLFIFNGLDKNEKDYVYKMLKENDKLKIIDVSSSLVYDYSVEELWLDPMNLLTIANNIKTGFSEYIESAYLLDEINDNYAILKQELIQLEADYREMVNRANNTTIIISDDTFLYLQKYGINVICLEENDNLTQKTIYTATNLLNSGQVKYIYTIAGVENNETVKKIIEETGAEVVELHNLYSRTEDEYNKEDDYFTLMKNNLELLKKELYD